VHLGQVRIIGCEFILFKLRGGILLNSIGSNELRNMCSWDLLVVLFFFVFFLRHGSLPIFNGIDRM